MSYCGYEIEYDGHLLSEFGGVIGGINRDAIQDINMQGTFEYFDKISQMSPFKYGTKGRHTDTLNKEMSVVFIDNNGLGIDKNKYSNFAQVFFNRNQFLELKFPDDNMRKDYVWKARLVNPQAKECNGYIYEVDFTIEYDSPYGKLLNDCELSYSDVISKTVTHNCESHQDSNIYPYIYIKAKGNVIIHNKTNNSKFIVNCNNGDEYEEITIDKFLYMTTNNQSNDPKLCHGVDLTNGKFFYLTYGNNEIEINGVDIKNITIKYPVYKKVGA